MPDNLFADLPALDSRDEQFTRLLAEPGLVVERIVSTGQASPPDFWYEQDQAEWIVLLSGEALLRFADETEPCRLLPGDCLDIAARRKHRVDWTKPGTHTVWLAIHRTGD